MMWHRIYYTTLILCGLAKKSGQIFCLTWCMEEDSLKLICRVENVSDYISIIDPQGKEQAHCRLSMTNPHCIPNWNVKIKSSTNMTKDIELVLKNAQPNMISGRWICSQKHQNTSTLVSTKNGIIVASNVHIFANEELNNASNMAKIRCISCREPRGNHVEFLIDNKTKDSVIYDRLTGRCRHIYGDCTPDKCMCSSDGREFTWITELTTDNLTISCVMSFSDKTKDSWFSTAANIYYNGKNFSNIDPTKIIDKKPEEREQNDKTDESIQENDNDPTKNETTTDDTTETDSPLNIWFVISIVTITVLVGIIIMILFFCWKYQKKRCTPIKNEESTVMERLYQDTQMVDPVEYTEIAEISDMRKVIKQSTSVVYFSTDLPEDDESGWESATETDIGRNREVKLSEARAFNGSPNTKLFHFKYAVELKHFKIFGLALSYKDELMLLDMDKERVILCDPKCEDKHIISVPYLPFDIATIPGKNISVTTCRYTDHIQVINTDDRQFIRKIKRESTESCGIVATSECVLVGGKQTIYIYNHFMEPMETLFVERITNPIRSLSCTDKRIYIIADRSNSIHCVTVCGQHIFSGKIGHLVCPFKTITDNDGNVYFLERFLSNVQQLSSHDENNSNIIMTKDHGLEYPNAFSFDSSKTNLYISNKSGSSLLVYGCRM